MSMKCLGLIKSHCDNGNKIDIVFELKKNKKIFDERANKF